MTSPYANHIPDDASGIGGSGLTNEYFSNAWYYMQLLLNTGSKHRNQTHPIDWGYIPGKVVGLNSYTHAPDIMRQLVWLIKSIQVLNNGVGLDKYYGWNPSWGGTPAILTWSVEQPMWSEVDMNTKASVIDAFTNAWLDGVTQYTPAQYVAAGEANPSTVPISYEFGDWPSQTWTMLPKMRAMGVSKPTLARVAGWSQSVWPLVNWMPQALGKP